MEQQKNFTNQNEEVCKEVVDKLSKNVTNSDTVPAGEFTIIRTVFKEASAMYMLLNNMIGYEKCYLKDIQLITETECRLINYIKSIYYIIDIHLLSRNELSLYIDCVSNFMDILNVLNTKEVAESADDECIFECLFNLRAKLGFAKENFELNDTEREKLKNEHIEYLTNPPANPLEGFGTKVETVVR